ncbi:MAG: ABC transporter ATP-binding protein [Crocinitomicaceae bacterium]|nr:ABC transporter ATP-binding protein [Crocinitomicaceae bacterium]
MEDTIAIKVENVSKVFPLRQPRVDSEGNTTNEHWALKDVSFEIKKGESVGIIGPNGSGKSTLLQLLAGITKPTTGQITIRGKVASILDIGAGFHPELSGRENVYLNGQIHGFSKKEIKSKFDEIVEFSGIEKFIDEPVKNYSNGMYLRLAFSIMAHLDFDVYLLDEVLSVGDEEFREKIHNLTKSWTGKKTQLVVTHDLIQTHSLFNRIISFKGLQIVEENLNKFNPVEFLLKEYIGNSYVQQDEFDFQLETKQYNLTIMCRKKC